MRIKNMENLKEIICQDCGAPRMVRSQNVKIVKRCVFCQAKFETGIEVKRQREVRKRKKIKEAGVIADKLR